MLMIEPGGGEGNRTPDLLNAIQALSQLSYAPWAPGVHKCPGTTNDSRGRDGCQANGAGANGLDVYFSNAFASGRCRRSLHLVGWPANYDATAAGMLDT